MHDSFQRQVADLRNQMREINQADPEDKITEVINTFDSIVSALECLADQLRTLGQ